VVLRRTIDVRPILIAILMSYALEPMVHRRGPLALPRGVAASLVFIATLGGVAALGYALSDQLAAAADRLPSAAQELRQAVQTYRNGAPGTVANVQAAATELQKLSGAAGPVVKKPFDLGDYFWQGWLSITTFSGDAIVVLFLAFYLLLAGICFDTGSSRSPIPPSRRKKSPSRFSI
jgi:predicted PurR-regulated permease PerM